MHKIQPRHLAIKILKRIDETNAYADIIINNELQKSNLSYIDKSLVNEIVNGTIRWQGKLDWLLQQFFQGDYKKCPANIKYILRISIYQLIYLDKVPAYAAINEGVALAKKLRGNYWGSKVNAILRTYLRQNDQIVYPDINANAAKHIAIKHSHPKWIVERWIHRYGVEQTEKLCAANNRTPEITLRLNHTKISIAQLQDILRHSGIETERSDYLDEFLKTDRLPELSQLKPFQEGLFSIQDESAGLVAHLIDPKPGEIIIDLCAAPGGKTTHAAELANNQCRIFAVDRYLNRLSLIFQNAKRLGLSNIHLVNADATQISGIQADKVVIDAPCSGFGVLSKRSDLRWKRTPAQIEQLVQLQKQILKNAVSLLKTGGILVYSTCTIEPEENEQMINHFLNKNKNFIIDDPANFITPKLISWGKYLYTYPHLHNMDGSFAVRLKNVPRT